MNFNIRVFTRADLINFKPEHDSFVGIDSDGCVFPTMEIKQKKCIHKTIVSHWHLEKIEKYARESAEFVNLYSIHRGNNRFPCLLWTFDLLRERPEVIAANVKLPEFKSLKKFVDSGAPLSNSELEKSVKASGDRELASILQWSEEVNAAIAGAVRKIKPFKWVRKSFEAIRKHSDAICVSQTPAEALVREWAEHDLTGYVKAIAGQELGAKREHIRMAAQRRYPGDKILMIGDSPGDLSAARDNHARFYPINPGREAASWERFYKEAYNKFLTGTYAGEYEDRLIGEFKALLPSVPPWKK